MKDHHKSHCTHQQSKQMSVHRVTDFLTQINNTGGSKFGVGESLKKTLKREQHGVSEVSLRAAATSSEDMAIPLDPMGQERTNRNGCSLNVYPLPSPKWTRCTSQRRCKRGAERDKVRRLRRSRKLQMTGCGSSPCHQCGRLRLSRHSCRLMNEIASFLMGKKKNSEASFVLKEVGLDPLSSEHEFSFEPTSRKECNQRGLEENGKLFEKTPKSTP